MLRGGLSLAVLSPREATAYVHRPGGAVALVPQSDFGQQVSYFPSEECCGEAHELEAAVWGLSHVWSSLAPLTPLPQPTPWVVLSEKSAHASAWTIFSPQQPEELEESYKFESRIPRSREYKGIFFSTNKTQTLHGLRRVILCLRETKTRHVI